MSLFTNPRVETQHLMSIGQVSVSAPSNIAIVKYWGKRGHQLPCNPSLSMTLENARSFFTLDWRGRSYQKEGIELEYLFEDEPKPAFETKLKKFLTSLMNEEWSFLRYFDLKIRSRNTFPHSAGIASSASSMAALAYCLVEMRDQIFQTSKSDEEKRKAISFLARLGSGSASRSISGPFILWGELSETLGDDTFGTEIHEVHSDFRNLCDTILILDDGVKKISSTEGHRLMEQHPYASLRFARARHHTEQLLMTLKDGDWKQFAIICEAEALELHGLMMTSTPPYILIRPNTLAAIEAIHEFRRETQVKLCFTLDAGANLHLLYPASEKAHVLSFVEEKCKPLCQNGRYLNDHAGLGARFENAGEPS